MGERMGGSGSVGGAFVSFTHGILLSDPMLWQSVITNYCALSVTITPADMLVTMGYPYKAG